MTNKQMTQYIKWKWLHLRPVWRKPHLERTPPSAEEVAEPEYFDLHLRTPDDFEAFATAMATPGDPLQRPGAVQTLMIETIQDVPPDTLQKVASALVDIPELRMGACNRDSVETFLSYIPPGTSIRYLATTYLPRRSFPCLAAVTALEIGDEIVHPGDGFCSLAHLKLHDHNWASVAASLETFEISAQLVSLCVSFARRAPVLPPISLAISLPNLRYLEVDESNSTVRCIEYSRLRNRD